MNTKKNFNKTANNFLTVLFYIIKNKKFTVDELVDYINQKNNISVKNFTILKYLRTMKKLNYKFIKEKNVYYLISTPFELDVNNDLINKFFGSYLTIMNKYNSNSQEKAKTIYSKISPFLKIKSINLLNKKYYSNENNAKKKYAIPEIFVNICEEKSRIKIKYTENNQILVFIIEPNEIVLNGGEYFIYALNLKKRIYELFNIKNIISIERLNQKNKFQYKKEKVLLQLTDKLAKSYTMKKDEKLIQKNQNGTIIMTYFYDREIFFRRILRYQTSCKIIAPKFLRKEYLEFVKNLYVMYTSPHL